MVSTRQGLTLAEFLELPEEEPALEYADGTVTQKVAPKGKHSALQDELVWYLNQILRPRRLARVFPELRTSFSGASHVPDIAVYRLDRVPRDATGQVANDFYTPPDVAIEIVSPGQSRRALVRRCQWYVDHGVPVALLLDPRDPSIRVFRPGTPVTMHRGDDRIALGEIGPGVELAVDRIFAALQLD